MIKILILLLFSLMTINAQTGRIFGTVADENSNPLIGVNVLVEGTIIGVATNSKGRFDIAKIKNGSYKISASIIGYSKYHSEEIIINNNETEINITLIPTTYQTEQLIISSNKFGQDLREISTSSYVLDSKVFSEKNYQKVDDAFRYVPGITMTQEQISIRGSSGYSRGAGTRVLVAIDGIPIYAPDTGEIIWEVIPINDINRIEILKGAGSSLYGSSAIGGVINILTNETASNPVTFLKAQGGIYSKPKFEDWQWTNKTLTFNRQSISHSRSIGNLGLSISISRFEDQSYRQNDDQVRYSAFVKAKYNFSESTSLSFLGTGYTREKSTFIYWKNLTNALTPSDGDLGQSIKSDRTILGFKFNHIFSETFTLTFVPSAYISYWKDQSVSKNKSSSQLYRNELRANYKFAENVNSVFGIEFQNNKVDATIFGNRNSLAYGIFSQTDYKIIEQLNLSVGLRFDNNKLENLASEYSLSPKLGINYKLNEQTFIRASAVKGFRAPSLAEAFTSTTTSGVTVKPNPNLKSETSYTFELGINQQIFKQINYDLAIFNNEYYDMIEPGFDNEGDILFRNLTRARIQGLEVNITSPLFAENLILNLGYNYLWAIDVENNVVLKYRPKHTFIAGINFKEEIFEAGIDFRYLSRVEKIDQEFVDLGLVPNGDERVKILVTDARISFNLYHFKIPARISLNAANIFNYYYVELIGNIAPIRNFSLNIEAIF